MTNYGKMKYIEQELRSFIPGLADIDLIVKTTPRHWHISIMLVFPKNRVVMCAIKNLDTLEIPIIWSKLKDELPPWVWSSEAVGE